eukprot:scaffold75561_cov55-Attheya_sp.AAC.10
MLSFTICNFVEHEVMHYFENLDNNIMHGFSAIVFRLNAFGCYETSWESCNDGNLEIRQVDDIRLRNKLPPNTPSIHKFARRVLKQSWKQYFQYQCRICFCPETCDKGVELSCDHFYCKDCIHT